ncbi:alpha/beta hydrolase [Pseudomonas gingeri]|uniref:Alpha/beta hydrolase n=1 Tax=Pseudomonas gingeri TaxID=117681 RepID=A0A7Y8C2X6_9PSED|nr:alpha/beta hydrolase [Pseudomonas gingeri]NWB96646.1 alpha/beta hydrolase [Pseudomonas gingeri]
MTDYPLSPQMGAFVARTLDFSYPDTSINGLRVGYSTMCRAFTPVRPAGISVSEQLIGQVPIRQYRPTSEPPADGWPCVVYLHGGGWVVGDLDSHDFITAELASRLDAVVIAVDYRLAPEQPFPAAFEDCLAVWRGVQAEAATWQLDPRRMAIAGDSAGGNLAAAVCLALRDSGQAQPLLQALIYPGLGGDDSLPSRTECADAPLLSASDVHCYHALYLPGSAKPSAYAMPLQATDLRGLAQAFIAVAQFDPLRDDGVQYRERLEAAAVAVDFHPGHGLVHGCLRARNLAPEVDLLYTRLLAALRNALAL